jgi:ribose 5-phosphate isomerase B
MKISIGCDHAGVDHREAIIEYLKTKSYTVIDHGTFSKESMDYPDIAHPVALDVENQTANLGILICGSANGVCITANKHQGIRAALCWQEEIAVLARQHNDANIIGIPARYVTTAQAIAMVDQFLHTDFEGGRHANRVAKIACGISE